MLLGYTRTLRVHRCWSGGGSTGLLSRGDGQRWRWAKIQRLVAGCCWASRRHHYRGLHRNSTCDCWPDYQSHCHRPCTQRPPSNCVSPLLLTGCYFQRVSVRKQNYHITWPLTATHYTSDNLKWCTRPILYDTSCLYVFYFKRLWICFNRSYCYTVGYNRLLASSCRPSVRPSITLYIVALMVDVQG